MTSCRWNSWAAARRILAALARSIRLAELCAAALNSNKLLISLLRADVHTDKHAAALLLAAVPTVYGLSQLLPPSKVEVADAEIRALGNAKRLN